MNHLVTVQHADGQFEEVETEAETHGLAATMAMRFSGAAKLVSVRTIRHAAGKCGRCGVWLFTEDQPLTSRGELRCWGCS